MLARADDYSRPATTDRRCAATSACRPTLLLAACLLLNGCSPFYVLRSGFEEARILWRRQPIERLLQQPDVDADTKSKLALALDVRIFARDALGLRAGGSFRSFARVDDDQVVHVVLAAHRDRLELLTWWFPIVGAVPYRGFFDKEHAQAAAVALDAKGFDAIVQPSVAFSTLGWFDDPLLSTLLKFDRVSLASVIIHELTHNTRYISGHSAFNESFATFVGYRGAVGFFHAHGESDNAARAQQLWHDALTFSTFLGEFTGRLRAAYATGIVATERRRLFDLAQVEFQTLPLATNLYGEFGRASLNNALILHYLLYNDRLALFDAALTRRGDDLGQTIAAVLQAVDGAADPYAAVAALVGDRARTEVAHRSE